ncbi:domain of Kin17 curved DNA-binding protein-domain-containing protein [Auriculariales sp. MPI-PUGE-AT-0066]|nr:domain of Kin17 curved DNA-binding protein-domain-containing protein [Auriculariales sp. MPI-PUGE-AT-0066]
MPKAEVGTPKFVANKMKAKGLQRLRWFCQVCEKQCRDENGFKCHTQSEGHLRAMLVVGENAGRHIADFSSQFQSEFVALLSRRYGTKRVLANRVYQEYIQDKSHLHMNATRWVTLTGFCQHLSRTGIAHVDETEKGWFLAWIDNSPKALAKADAALKKERMTTSDEQRERVLLAEQIERAAAIEEANADGSGSGGASGSRSASPAPAPALELAQGDGERVKLSVSLKPSAPVAAPAPAVKLGLNAFKAAAKPAAVNPLKGNVFKSAGSGSSNALAGQKRSADQMSAVERVMFVDQERKRRRMEMEAR